MSYTLNTPTPSSSNIQVFYASGDWVKPIGASMIRFMLIGAGSGGGVGSSSGSGFGGSSGAVTNWVGPAIFVPDTLRVNVGVGGAQASDGTATTVVYQQRDGTGYTLLTANPGVVSPDAGGTAFTGSPFASSGIWSSTAGQTGGSGGVTASTTTFLSAGSAGSAGAATPSSAVNGQWGFTTAGTPAGGTTLAIPGRSNLLSFPFYSLGGAGGATNDTIGTAGGYGGIGCGGGGSGEDALTGGRGGDGFAIVWAW